MSNFEIPSNIKQIGSISDGMRIYMEDYVCTYIQALSNSYENNEVLAVLIGRHLTIDSAPVLFINGCIEGKYCIEDGGILTFSEKSYDYILGQKDKYFPKTDIVGWVQSQPSYGTYLNSLYKKYHMNNFKKEYQVLFVTDPIQKLNCFYAYNEDMTQLEEINGYFIYYDKNRNMHEYMIDNKDENLKLKDKLAIYAEEEDIKNSAHIAEREEKRRKTPSEAQIRTRQAVRKRKTRYDQKRTVNMLAALSAIMFLISGVMGAGLIKSEERIAVLEQNLSALNTAYRNISASMEETQAAFLGQSEQKDNSEENPVPPSETTPQEQNTEAAVTEPPAEAPPSEAPVETPAETPSPSPVPQTESSAIPESYIVQQGDNLLYISRKFYGSENMVEKIMEANNMDNPDTIYFGKKLILPRP